MVRGENGATAGAPAAAADASRGKVLVPNAKVGKIIGRRGAMIRELQEKSGAKIDVSDEIEKGLKVVYLRGDEKAIKKAEALISNAVSDEPVSPIKSGENDITVEFSIPEDKCGLVVGARGSKIREIQSATKTNVNVGFRDTAVNGMVKVTLNGTKDRCDNARKMIDDLIDESNTSFGDASEEAPFSTSMMIPSDMTRRLIGPQGSTIRDIQNRCNAQVDVARRDTAVNGEIEVVLTGAPDCCDAARHAIEDLIHGGDNVDTTTMWIEDKMCGLIIGSRGSKIRDIQYQSGANVNIDKREMAQDGKVQVTITGNPSQNAKARNIIEDIIADSRQADDREPVQQSAFDNAAENCIQIWVPEKKCGLIIGRGGSKISEIQEMSNTRVDVNSRERNSDGMCLVKVSGTKDDCDEARRIIQDIVEEIDNQDRDERGSMDIWVDTGCLGRIIGKGGAKIREIERSYKVKIDVKKDEVEDNETKVILIGSKDAVLASRDYIYELIDDEE